MSEDSKDLLAYKMWLVSSPFMVQQSPSLHNQDRGMQLPTSPDQWPVKLEKDATDNASFVTAQQSKRGRKKSVTTGADHMNQIDMLKAVSAKIGDTASLQSNGVDSELERRLQNNIIAFSGSNSLAACFQYGGGDDKQALPRTACQTCGKWFRSRQQLTQHMLVHTDVRKYRCNFCGRAFKQPSHLQQHHRIHTGEKPYRCPLAGCSRAFPQLSNLNHHLRNHDKPDPPTENTCLFCHRTYASEAVLKNHMAKIHLYNGDGQSKDSAVADSTENPSPISVTTGIPPSHKLAKGSYSEQLRNLASQPKVEGNVTSGLSLEEQLRADLIRAGVMNSAQGGNFTNAMNAYQIFNTIPLEKIRRSQDLMSQQTAMIDVIESLSRAPSTESIAMRNTLVSNMAASTSASSSCLSSGNSETTMSVNRTDSFASSDIKNAASNQTARIDKNSVTNAYDAILRSQNGRLQNATHTEAAVRKIVESSDDNGTLKRKREPVKLTSSDITTIGEEIAINNVRNISVHENYRYTLGNDGGWTLDGLVNADETARSDSVVNSDDPETSFSETSSPDYDAVEEAGGTFEFNIPKYSNISSDNAVKKKQLSSSTDSNIDLNLESCKSINDDEMGCTSVASGFQEGDKQAHSTNISAISKQNDNATYVISTDCGLIDRATISSSVVQSNDNCHEFEKQRLNVGLKSNSRKRKAFQPQRVIYNGGTAE